MFYGLKPEINAFIHSFIHSLLRGGHGRGGREERAEEERKSLDGRGNGISLHNIFCNF